MLYRELPPGPGLEGVVECLWTLEGVGDGGEEVVLPDGRPEVVLHFGERFERAADGAFELQPRWIAAGQLRGPLLLRATGRVDVLAARLAPAGAARLFGPRMDELTGRAPALEALLDGADRAAERWEPLDGPARAEAFARWLAARLAPRRDVTVEAAVARIEASRGRVAVDLLAREAGLSTRSLERRFARAVGLSPKRLARVARFGHALERLRRGEPAARVALACGFADQPHLVNDVREMCGRPPAAWLRAEHRLADLLLGSAR